jgi:hypothetical protein
MTLGNMREPGVQNLIAFCLNDACRDTALIDLSSYPADTEVPWFKSRVKCGGKRVDVPAELEGTAADVNQARFAVSRWSSRHFPKVERVLTYPRLIGRDGCDGASS